MICECRKCKVQRCEHEYLRPTRCNGRSNPAGLGKIDDTVLNCTVERSALGCNWHAHGIEKMQILAKSAPNVRISTTTELKLLLPARELPLIIHRRFSSWCASIVQHRDIHSLACHRDTCLSIWKLLDEDEIILSALRRDVAELYRIGHLSLHHRLRQIDGPETVWRLNRAEQAIVEMERSCGPTSVCILA